MFLHKLISRTSVFYTTNKHFTSSTVVIMTDLHVGCACQLTTARKNLEFLSPPHLLRTHTSVQPHPVIPNPALILGLAFVNSSLAFQPRSAVTLNLTRIDSQQEEREPLSSLIPLISQPTISSPEWALFTCCSSILSLFHHYIPFSSLCSLAFCFSCPVICLSVFQSNRCVKWLSTLVLFGELIIAVFSPFCDSLT